MTPSTNAAAVLLPGFVGTELPEWLAARLRNGLAGVCIFGNNIESREQLRELTGAIREANPDSLIAIDEEGGDVTRLYYDQGSPYPGNALLGRINDLDYTEQVARQVGWELRLAGVNLNFAPDVDINSNADNPVIGVRSFGSDAALVAAHSAAWVRGHESTGVAVSAKHFPGHGDTAQDSHLALPVVDLPLSALRERELAPFEAVVAAGARTVMTSHILLPQVDPSGPATFSRIVLEDLLRRDLGFDGVIVSDALDMAGASGEVGIPEAAVLAIAAGCDLLCIGTDNTDEQLDAIEHALQTAVSTGRLTSARLEDAASRNIALARELAAQADALPIPATTADEPSFDLERSAAAFDVRAGVSVEHDRTLVALQTVANIAIGVAPWGPRFDARTGSGEELAATGGQLVLVGKDNHRHAWVRDLIDRERQANPSVLVVDMGWPDDSRAYADVATFGASRHAGAALEAWLEREAR
ncbi:beta-N-acetylhexosaminidase [Glaciihabitans arcticus]|uniref:Beta-N-acetylhexosaminidase n=1 Tax=Glaciihabitans arcticus TaxID=2668039 RepID=A0A4Q9GU54_9MICO|nr:beta-N-acetylhexosaminidase [Glaciihabitans arcticus]TBN57734.1 beta-N-acetylhexosaminidase [Glaciihabitans arcticus]